MSDSFADLWSSSLPPSSKPTPAPNKLGNISAQGPPQRRRPQYDAFTLLASSSAPNSRPITPSSITSTVQTNLKPTTPSNRNGGGDPFGALLSDSLPSTNNALKMTIAERAAQAERE